jgi:hypothetical protein
MHRLTSLTAMAVALCMTVFGASGASARDLDGRYANSPLKQWFDQLASGKGLCCSFPDTAVVSEPNRFGPAVVWPYLDAMGATQIRCFMPGAGV